MSEKLEIGQLTEILDDITHDRAQFVSECTRINALLTGTLRLLSGEGEPMLRRLHGSPDRVTAHLMRSFHELEASATKGYDDVEIKVRAVIDTLRKQ